jgi:hypothetical protein
MLVIVNNYMPYSVVWQSFNGCWETIDSDLVELDDLYRKESVLRRRSVVESRDIV